MVADRIRQARQMRRMSLRELAARVGKSYEAIRRYENGSLGVNSAALLKIADALSLPPSFFLRRAYLDSTRVPAFRAHPRLTNAERKAVQAQGSEAIERFLEVALITGTPVVAPIPIGFPKTVTSFDDVERAAEGLRESWHLGLDAIGPLIRLLEERGVPVCEIDAPEGVDACLIEFNSRHGDGVAIGVRPGVPGDRLRFNLAHEVAHMVLRPAGLDEEKAAHRFAAAFLVPAWVARAELGQTRSSISLNELHDLKHRYGMSMQAWIYRARELDIISTQHMRELRTTLNSVLGETKEPGADLFVEEPGRLKRMIDRAIAEQLISPQKAAELEQMDLVQWRRTRMSR